MFTHTFEPLLVAKAARNNRYFVPTMSKAHFKVLSGLILNIKKGKKRIAM
jgi:hypothetical protein